MKLQSFTFHPHAIQVDGRPVHSVHVGRDGVTRIALEAGVLIVERNAVPSTWFVVTDFGVGMPLPAVPQDAQPVTLPESARKAKDKR